MKRPFYDRKEELAQLLHRYRKQTKAELLVVYGRRRVGKTELLKQFLTKIEAKHFYFYIDLLEKPMLLDALSKEVLTQLGEGIRFNDWDDFFEYVYTKAEKTPFVLIFDFPLEFDVF